MISLTGRNNTGFSLIEIMVSIAILSLGLVLILQGFAQSLNTLRISEDNLKATLMAENKIAEAEIQAREDGDALEAGLEEKFEFENIKCKWRVKATPVEWKMEEIPESYQELREVEASLSWEEGKREGRIPLVTFMRQQAESSPSASY